MTDFVDIPMTTNAADLKALAIARLKTSWPDWTDENDGDPDVVIIDALSPLAENAMQQASNMAAEALVGLGGLWGIPWSPGTGSYTTLQITAQDANGYDLPAGGTANIDGYAFQLVDDLAIPIGQTTTQGLAVCTTPTSAADGLTGASALAPISLPVWVTGLAVLSPTTGGADPDTAETYLTKVSTDRRLTSRAVVTLLDAELAAMEVPGVARAHADKDTSRNVTVTVINDLGQPVSAAVRSAVLAMFVTSRTVNAIFNVVSPTYTTVNVTYTVQREGPGIDPATLLTACNLALTQELSPATAGLVGKGDPSVSSTTWVVDPKVYANRLIAALTSVVGARVVLAISINGGANGADLALSGAVPLPQPGTFTGTIV